VNTKLLYVFGVPALAGVALAGGLRRAFQGRPAIYWTGFLVWMGLAAPFSFWKGASVGQFLSYAAREYIMLLVIAGLVLSWRECRMLMYASPGAGFSAWLPACFQRPGEGGPPDSRIRNHDQCE